MAVLTVVKIVNTAPTAETLTPAAGGGDSFPNTGKEFLAVKNAGGGAITVTVVAQGDACNRGVAATTAHDKTFSIPNDSAIYLLGPFPTAFFNDVNGRAQVTYSGVTSVTVNPFTLPPA